MSSNSNQMKIAIVSGASKKGDSVRGIGAHNSNLFAAFRKTSYKQSLPLRGKNYEIPEVSMNDDLSKFDIVHFTVFRPFFISLPFFKPKNTKFILTIHDLIMLIYPKHYPSGVKGWIKLQINKYLIKKHVDRIITISETSKKDICRFFRVKPEIVDVVYLAPKAAIKKIKNGEWEKDIRKKYNLPEKFVLFDHGLNFNKNLKTLVEACNRVNIPLVAIDEDTKNIEKLDLNHPELRHLKGVDFSKVIRPGYVIDEDLNCLFNLATICIQPSYYEGFGMPPIEAMTVGSPVICSKTQALVEVCGDACLYFDPYNALDLVEKIKMYLKDPKLRSEYVKKGYEQAKKYNWEKAAKETLESYRRV